MDKKYKYYKSNGKLFRCYVETDNDPLNPRYDYDGNIGKMMCWHRHYQLGDYKDNDYENNEYFLSDMLRKNVPEKSIINYVKNKKASNGLELRYNRKEKMWQLWGTYYWLPLGSCKDASFGVIEENENIEWLVDEIIEALPQQDVWYLLEKHANIIFLPLYLYDHSGISMSCSHGYPYNDRWDSCCVGYIYTDKETVLDTCGNANKRNWKKIAYENMRGEVEIYNQMLVGEVYDIFVEEYDGKLDDWDFADYCGGFFNDKWGEELLVNIARDYGISENLYDTMSEAIADKSAA